MKTKLQLRTSAAIFILIASIAAVLAQPAPGNSPVVNPATGLPAPGVAPTIDLTTGLTAPAAFAEPQWIDPNWTDPGIVLTNVVYDNVPLNVVADILRQRFENYFDILPMPRTYGQDWGNQISIQLQLRNVKASEIFNAMNLVFENDRTPLRWKLKVNGNRPTVLLRVLPEAAPEPPPVVRKVFFVGDLFGVKKSDGTNDLQQISRIVDAIQVVWERSGVRPPTLNNVVQLYMPAQLLIIIGTPEQIDLAQQTLLALKQKAELERSRQKAAELKPKTDEPKPTGSPGSSQPAQ